MRASSDVSGTGLNGPTQSETAATRAADIGLRCTACGLAGTEFRVPENGPRAGHALCDACFRKLAAPCDSSKPLLAESWIDGLLAQRTALQTENAALRERLELAKGILELFTGAVSRGDRNGRRTLLGGQAIKAADRARAFLDAMRGGAL